VLASHRENTRQDPGNRFRDRQESLMLGPFVIEALPGIGSGRQVNTQTSATVIVRKLRQTYIRKYSFFRVDVAQPRWHGSPTPELSDLTLRLGRLGVLRVLPGGVCRARRPSFREVFGHQYRAVRFAIDRQFRARYS